MFEKTGKKSHLSSPRACFFPLPSGEATCWKGRGKEKSKIKTTPKLSEGLAVFPAMGGKISSHAYSLFLEIVGVQRHKFQRQTSFPHCSAMFGAKPWGQVCPLPVIFCWAQGREELCCWHSTPAHALSWPEPFPKDGNGSVKSPSSTFSAELRVEIFGVIC